MMTGDHALVLPVMLTALIGFALSRLVWWKGIYHTLVRNHIAAATPPPR
ncbi:MAG TPA: hypothetical protein VGC15_02775 [Acetobacteraceae bacterium]